MAEKVLRPSAAPRWMNCTASVALCDGLPDESGPAAREGTAAHKLLELCLRNTETEADQYLGMTESPKVGEIPWDADMVSGVNLALDAIYAHVEPETHLFVEKFVKAIPPVMGFKSEGTADCFLWDPNRKVLHLFDLKYGFGIVEPTSEQIFVYMLGAVRFLREKGEAAPETIRLTIIQPRASHPEGPVRTVAVDMLDFLDFEMRATAKVVEIATGLTALKSGPHCKYCPALKHDRCQLRQDELASVFAAVADPIVEPLNVDTFAERLEQAEAVAPYIEALKEKAEEIARQGAKAAEKIRRKWIKGNNKPRKWAVEDPAEVARKVLEKTGVAIGETKTVVPTPPQAEKILSREAFKKISELVAPVEPGKPRLVPVSDPGEAIDPNGVETPFAAVNV